MDDPTTQSLMEYEINKLNKKVSKFEAVIAKLIKENTSLKAKVNTLELTISKICQKINIPFSNQQQETQISPLPNTNTNSKLRLINKTSIDANINNSNNNKNSNIVEEETWLYYILKKDKIKKENIIKSLNITNKEDLTYIELNGDWKNENEMFIKLLKSFKKFDEVENEFEDMNSEQLAEYFQEILKIAFMGDVAIVIRNVPGVKYKKKYDSIIDNIGTLSGIIYKCFNSINEDEEDNSYGTIALLLEVDEPLNIINIIKNDSRMILSIDKLKCK